jgi:transcriptional regulator with XRE-family HTH domain
MHRQLGEFIRAHRERIKPEELGFPAGGRRRTPGLRREELAQVCGVSPTWLTWLEQGRPISPSPKTLARLADVMRLTPAERAYLFQLSERLDPRHEESRADANEEFASLVQAIKTPAYILDRQWDAIAWNRPARELLIGWLEGSPGKLPRPNLLRFMFLEPGARSLTADWPQRTARLVAEFRADCGKHVDLPPISDLVSELSRSSEEFRGLWKKQDVVNREGGLRRFEHPERGALTFEQITLHPATRRDLKLVVLLPSAD